MTNGLAQYITVEESTSTQWVNVYILSDNKRGMYRIICTGTSLFIFGNMKQNLMWWTIFVTASTATTLVQGDENGRMATNSVHQWVEMVVEQIQMKTLKSFRGFLL